MEDRIVNDPPLDTTTPERSRQTLARGVLVFRWVALTWMTILAIASHNELQRPVLAWFAVALAGGWTAYLTFEHRNWTPLTVGADLVVGATLMVVSGLVVEGGQFFDRSFFAAGYPFSAALLWGTVWGPLEGLLAGALLGLLYAGAAVLNGVSVEEMVEELDGRRLQTVASNLINYLVAGAAVGLVSRLLVRSARAVQNANEQLVAERERTARLQERDKLAREIHDSVLQALAFVHKRGREAAQRDHVSPAEMAELADIAGRQESELRSLILREPDEEPVGHASLRARLEELAREVVAVPVAVSAVGPILMKQACADEIAAAVRQALDNVVRHAHSNSAAVFADSEGGYVTVTIRDDGAGFQYDEDDLRVRGKAGLLKSMKGRISDLDGTMTVTSAPGRGTEIEFRIPVESVT